MYIRKCHLQNLFRSQPINIVLLLRPCEEYMHQKTNYQWFRLWLVAWLVPIHYMNQCWILLIRTLGTNFSPTLSEIHTFLFKKMHLDMSSVKWWPFCFCLTVLTQISWVNHMGNTGPWTSVTPRVTTGQLICIGSAFNVLTSDCCTNLSWSLSVVYKPWLLEVLYNTHRWDTDSLTNLCMDNQWTGHVWMAFSKLASHLHSVIAILITLVANTISPIIYAHAYVVGCVFVFLLSTMSLPLTLPVKLTLDDFHLDP